MNVIYIIHHIMHSEIKKNIEIHLIAKIKEKN